jgi:hypothetical protein
VANEIVIETGRCGIDHNKKLVIVNQDVNLINQNTQPKDAIFINDKHYTLENPINNLQIGTPYSILDADQNRYTLYFTELPLIHITTENTIVDEPKVAATFTIAEGNADIITSDIGIEYRGGTSQRLPKKSFRIGFWQDNNDDLLNRSYPFFGSDISTIRETKDYTNVEVSIYNLTGQLLKVIHFDEISDESLFASLALPGGIYIIKIQNTRIKEIRKIIIP